VGIVHKTHVIKYTPRKINVRNYKNYNKESFKQDILYAPWINCVNKNNLNNAWNLFKHHLAKIVNKHAPLIERKVRGKTNPWFTKDIKSKMNTRDYFLRCAKRTNTISDWASYKKLRNCVSFLIRQAKANHVRSMFRENKSSPKFFWNQIKKAYPIKNSEGPPKTFKSDNRLITDKSIISNSFCAYFANIGSQLVETITTLKDSTWIPFNGFK
jgi:hypothetical protein